MTTERLGLVIPPIGNPGTAYAADVNAALAVIDKAQAFNLRSFGAACDNVTDDTAAVIDCLDHFSGTGDQLAAKVYVPGISVISDQILQKGRNIEWFGDGWGKAAGGAAGVGAGGAFKWAEGAPSDRAMFRVEGCFASSFKRLRLIPATTGTESPLEYNRVADETGNKFMRTEDLFMGTFFGYDGDSYGDTPFTQGIRWTGVNADGDSGVHTNVQFQGVANKCIDIAHSQAGGHLWISPIFATGAIGLSTMAPTRLIDPQFNNISDTNIEILNNQWVHCIGHISEGCRQIARLGSGYLSIEGGSFQLGENVDPDGVLIDGSYFANNRLMMSRFLFQKKLGYAGPDMRILLNHPGDLVKTGEFHQVEFCDPVEDIFDVGVLPDHVDQHRTLQLIDCLDPNGPVNFTNRYTGGYTPNYPDAYDKTRQDILSPGQRWATLNGFMEISELSYSPDAPLGSHGLGLGGARLFVKDSGAGKLILYAIFPTGAPQQLAIQP